MKLGQNPLPNKSSSNFTISKIGTALFLCLFFRYGGRMRLKKGLVSLERNKSQDLLKMLNEIEYKLSHLR